MTKQNNLRKHIAPYEKPNIKSSAWQLINTLVPFFMLWFLAYESLSISYILAFGLSTIAAGFLVRIFIIFHDCCHQSFFKNQLANKIIGTITGILTLCPYEQWRRSHSIHHATSSNLNKRGTGDVWVLTVEEYVSAPLWLRFAYRMYRNPFVMFGLGPIYIFLISYRFNVKGARLNERVNTYITNLSIVGLAGLLCWTIGWKSFLMIQGPIFFVSGSLGIWLFYVQHQFENSYFEKEEEWDYVKAALEGSSFYKLPKLLQWITGNIGFHHVHHLSPRVPNYYLEEVHNSHLSLQNVQTITIASSLRSLRFRLWDEQNKKFVGFKEIKDFTVEHQKNNVSVHVKSEL
ncbi:fatty acid desaturase [Aneurinibacillus aneurinilyticus]|jgi:omega-6 fatty acid desaturase (delta-12 desaturase)|uniref:Fatty acid desaturase n=2 Tax=Aneurinibacillus aneurinilyticus TaxID=1391 RepID=A0A848CS31_ANEAE|nr:fatty acid desaturase [Aneurinibacillus aneurinilyticus]ERI11773.1 stearoyl-CoA 9-desaturase [Aneurinibacillus aneurinilyticus ATCC 12856]MCI1694893.1 fatty acid desaturase [Aneurinibacillus aneurinilyticus]MED0673613.1 fatty acid desaturase [Aneurinibacillus aneurinilyticus]MED0706605.1 fatty acid desaturase [Aneurinibacillus aneurinilyticus]MED0725578.1 fatty acid desaturase [Aneurinibacillus aneurinilyticus]